MDDGMIVLIAPGVVIGIFFALCCIKCYNKLNENSQIVPL